MSGSETWTRTPSEFWTPTGPSKIHIDACETGHKVGYHKESNGWRSGRTSATAIQGSLPTQTAGSGSREPTVGKAVRPSSDAMMAGIAMTVIPRMSTNGTSRFAPTGPPAAEGKARYAHESGSV
jgi:hypothetical protein